MPLSNSILAYEDVQKVMDQALEKDLGLSIVFDTHGGAVQFRQRCYKFRSLAKKMSEAAWEPDDTRFGTSIYDTLSIVIKEKVIGEPWNVEIRKREKTKYDLRELKV